MTVDCSGAGPGIADALRAARPGGRHVQIGLAGKDVTLPFDRICFKELTVTAGFASTPVSWRRALALLERGAIDLPGLVTEVVALRDFRRAFDDTRAGAGVKYVLDPAG